MLADAASVFNGKFYIHGGGWDSLVMGQFPAAHPSMALAVLLSADDGEAPGQGEFRVQLVDDDGNDLGVGAAAAIGIGQSPLHRPGQRTSVPIAVPFSGLRFERPGTYEFRVFWNGTQLNPSVTFSVSALPATPPVASSPPMQAGSP
jgi:hypothetical protein